MLSEIMLQCKSRVSNDFASLLITTAVPCPLLPRDHQSRQVASAFVILIHRHYRLRYWFIVITLVVFNKPLSVNCCRCMYIYNVRR